MNEDGVVGKSLELDEDMALEIFALSIEVAEANRKLGRVAMAFVIGTDGDVFDVGIEKLVLINCVFDFIENSIKLFFGVDFDDLALVQSPRSVNLCHEVFFVNVVTAGVAIFLAILLGNFRQIGEIRVERDAVSAGAVVVPNTVLYFDDDRLLGFGVVVVVVFFDRFTQVRAGPDDVVFRHRFWVWKYSEKCLLTSPVRG